MTTKNEKNDVISHLTKQLYFHSPKTYGHSAIVSNIATSFGKEIGLDEQEIKKLRIAGLLHDIGKLNIPSEILHKTTSLTDEEYRIVKNHPKYGIDILIDNDFIDRDIINLTLFHHERIDGKGYPFGLKGDKIPKLARILCICDSFDAMYTARDYSQGHDLNYVIEELLKNAGTQFDEEYVNLFVDFLRGKKTKTKS